MVKLFLNFSQSKPFLLFFYITLFYFSLYFSTSNTTTLILSLFLSIAVYSVTKNIKETFFYLFIALLPFAKGKGIHIVILEKKQIAKNALFDVDYLFSYYLSSIYLTLFYFAVLRDFLSKKIKKIEINKTNKIAILLFLTFTFLNTINAITTKFELPVLLSSLQLLILLSIFLIPFFINTKKIYKNIYLVCASSTLFQSIWLLLQTINKGHLNKDIEVFLQGFEYSVLSTENADLQRLPGTFFESSILGTFLITNIVLMLFGLLQMKITNKIEKLLIQTAIFFGIMATILTGSRAIYVLLFFSLLIVIKIGNLANKKNIEKLFNLYKNNLSLILTTVLLMFLMLPYFFVRIGSVSQTFSAEGSGTYRIQLTEYALRIMEKKPLLGVGLNLSPYYLATAFTTEDYFIDPAHPHNIFIQLLAETGISGTILFLLFIYLILRKNLHEISRSSSFFFASILFLLCAQIYPIFINHMEIISYLFLFLGLTAYDNQQK